MFTPKYFAVSTDSNSYRQFPIEYKIHKRQLSLCGNIIREDCVERELAIRELTFKHHTSNIYKYKYCTRSRLTMMAGVGVAHTLLKKKKKKDNNTKL